jgi:hypothetical protein
VRWNAPEDFQSYAIVAVSARNYLPLQETLMTTSCARVCWNHQK